MSQNQERQTPEQQNGDQPHVSLDQALRAQKAMRDAAGLPPESFPVQAFVGMISDEIEALREQGHTDEAIARLIRESANVGITASQIAENYASAEHRHPPAE